jgi:DnaJ-class molecular chaperone
MKPETDREPCPACGGSGQLSQFKGVSRFLLSVEECPACAGLGYTLPSEEESSENQSPEARTGDP